MAQDSAAMTPTSWADDEPEHEVVTKATAPLPWHGSGWQAQAEQRGGFFPTVAPAFDSAPAGPAACGGFYSVAGGDLKPSGPGPCISAMPMKRVPMHTDWLGPSDTASVSSASQSEASSAWAGLPLSTPSGPGLPTGWPSQPMPPLQWIGAVPQAAVSPAPSITPVPPRGRAARRTSRTPSVAGSGGEVSPRPQQQKPAAPSGMASVRALLEKLGFEQYADVFDAAGLDRMDLVAGAGDDEFAECGVKPVHRRRILAAARERLGGAPTDHRIQPNPLLEAAAPRAPGSWTPAQEKVAEEWLRDAAAGHGAKLCIISCRYHPESATLCVRYVSADGGVVPHLASLLRTAQDHFLCRVWMGPAKEIVEVMNQAASPPSSPAPTPPAPSPPTPSPPAEARLNPLAQTNPLAQPNPLAAARPSRPPQPVQRASEAPCLIPDDFDLVDQAVPRSRSAPAPRRPSDEE
eukprot:TRINITY_DN5377_c0_g1_i1.p1 TRINITY_DN5377_c0_g1~~TRINITY_DN5377_c0_g1_i1.p1  ORF type:complete len:481 (+),score=87.93 TRINITY_DN5377_c0_g1_i1:58-1443(+)